MALLESNLDEITRRQSQPNYIQDKDFIKVFEPFLKVQKILGSSRVNIKDGSITPPTKIHKCYTMICLIIMSISIMQLIMSYMVRFSNNRKMFYLWIVGLFSIEVIFVGFLIYARFWDNEENIRLYLKMQEIDRIMGTNRNINIMLQKQNRKTTYSLVSFFVILFLASFILAGDEYGILELIGSVYTFETVVFELCCCSIHIRFFYTRVHQLNSQLSKLVGEKKCSVAVLSIERETGHRFIQLSTDEQDCDSTDIYLKEIFTGFILLKELYRFQMFVFCAAFITWVLFTFEHGILLMQSDETDKRMFLIDFLNLLLLALIYLFLLLWLSVGTETFMREVRKTKHLSILIICHYAEGPLRSTAKNMLSLIEETPPSFSVYGMWSMDAKLMINIFNLVTNFILTIIQFTFL